MRVCHINLSKDFRGGEYQTIELIESLGKRYEQSAIVRRETPLAGYLDRYPWLNVNRVSGLLQAIRRSRGFDVLHIHEGRGVQIGAARSVLSGTPFVVTRRVLKSPSDRLVTRWCYRKATRIAAVSNAVGASIQTFDDTLPIETVYDCARKLTANGASGKQIRGMRSDGIVFGHVGEFDDAVKGQGTIIEVARKSLTANPRALFCLVGRGKDEELLRERARGLPNVCFIDWTRHVGDLYSAMDVFLFPSHNEGLGSAVLEAMSFGLPVLASRVGGVPEVVQHGLNGLLFEPGDAERLLRYVDRLANSTELRQRMGGASRAIASDFSASSMAAGYEHIYEYIAGLPNWQTSTQHRDVRGP